MQFQQKIKFEESVRNRCVFLLHQARGAVIRTRTQQKKQFFQLNIWTAPYSKFLASMTTPAQEDSGPPKPGWFGTGRSEARLVRNGPFRRQVSEGSHVFPKAPEGVRRWGWHHDASTAMMHPPSCCIHPHDASIAPMHSAS